MKKDKKYEDICKNLGSFHQNWRMMFRQKKMIILRIRFLYYLQTRLYICMKTDI